MTTRTRHTVSAFSTELAKIIDAAMAGRRPRMTRADLARATGIEPSQISRMLKPSKPMLVDELALICRVLRLDLRDVVDEAQRLASLNEADPMVSLDLRDVVDESQRLAILNGADDVMNDEGEDAQDGAEEAAGHAQMQGPGDTRTVPSTTAREQRRRRASGSAGTRTHDNR